MRGRAREGVADGDEGACFADSVSLLSLLSCRRVPRQGMHRLLGMIAHQASFIAFTKRAA